MATSAQIKAARALLGWKQSELADMAGLSLPSINNIERDIISPRAGTVRKIRETMESAGIVFIDDSGVQRKKEMFEVLQYEGPNFIEKQNDDLFTCMQGPEDEVLMCSLDEKMFPKYASDQIMRYEAYQKKTGFKERILIEEGDTFLLAKPQAYRWIPKELMGKVAYLTYKNRFVLLNWVEKRVVIVKNQMIADNFQTQFNYLWKLGKKIPAYITRKIDDPKFVENLHKRSAKDKK